MSLPGNRRRYSRKLLLFMLLMESELFLIMVNVQRDSMASWDQTLRAEEIKKNSISWFSFSFWSLGKAEDKIQEIHALGNLNVYRKYEGNLSMPCCDIWLCSTMSHRRPDVRQLDCQTDIAIARAAPRARLKKIKHHTDVLRQRQSRCRNSNTHGMEVLLRIKEELIGYGAH